MADKQKTIDSQQLMRKITELARDRLKNSDVLSLENLRELQIQKSAPRILIIEDDDMARRGLRRILEADGYMVLTANDATQMTAAIGSELVDLVVLDVGLPWLNGYELAQILKDSADFKSVPIVFISGHAGAQDIKKAFAIGADDYITKPFTSDQVRNSIATLLKLHSRDSKR